MANKDTDGTLAANSDTKYPSQKAVKTYVDTSVAGVIDATDLNNKGDIIVASADNTPDVLSVVSNYYKLKSDSSKTTGLKWQREEVFNVVDYGAVGNGSTDDTLALQATIDAAELNGGGVVFLPKGIYKITSELVHNIADVGGGVMIVGESRYGTVIKAYTNTQTVIKFTNVDGSGIENLTIDSGVTKTGGYGIHFNGTPRHYSVRNVDIKNMYYGIGGSPAAGICDNLYIENAVHSYIYLIGNGADATFTNILCDNTTDTGSDIGIYLLGAVQGAVFKNIDIHQVDTGVKVDNTGGVVSLEWIWFEGVMADSCRNNGWEIGVGTGEPQRGINMINCWAGSNGENGVYISNNIIDLNIVGGRYIHNGYHGIDIDGGINISINGNKILNNSDFSSSTYHGINVGAGVTHFSIVGNEIASGISDYPSGTQGYGINIETGASDYYIINGNNLYSNATGTINDGGTGTNKFVDALITATPAEINKLDGFTGTYEDLNYAKDLRATGVTSTEFDVLDGINDSWTSFTPSWNNITVGNGTTAGYYKQIGKTVFVRAYIVFGSTTSVSGTMSLNLPVSTASYGTTTPIGLARMFDNGGSSYFGVLTNAGGFPVWNASGTYLTTSANSATVPFTWGTGDEIAIQGVYEAA